MDSLAFLQFDYYIKETWQSKKYFRLLYSGEMGAIKMLVIEWLPIPSQIEGLS